MFTVQASDTITRARQYADMETSTPANDFVTDTEFLAYFNISYRRLLDIVIANNGSELVAKRQTLTAPSWTIPTDFYHPIAVEIQTDPNRWVSLPVANFLERNRHTDQARPAYRIMALSGGSPLSLVWFPSDTTITSVRLWYAAVPDLISSVAFYASFGGWDDFVALDMAVQALAKEDRDIGPLSSERSRAEKRIAQSCADNAVVTPEKIADVAVYPEDYRDWTHGPGGWLVP